MKHIILFTWMIITGICLNAQSAVMLHHAGTGTPYYGQSGFANAYAAAQDGDTILLPGGYFPPPNPFDKRIAVIGAGHNPDSTQATLPTVITSGITIGENADSCLLMGMRIQGGIGFGYNARTNYFVFSRLYLEGGISSGSDGVNNATNGSIRECVVSGELNGAGFDRCSITNNIFLFRIISFRNALFGNNVFLGGQPAGESPYVIISSTDCVIRNNIFYKGVYDWSGCTNNIMQRNIFKNEPAAGTNTYQSNYFNVNTSTLFVSYNDTYSYASNLHLTSPASYPGTDATQVGLYGTNAPWKEGSVPFNPHIQTKSIADQTNSNGTLQVQVKVAAQNQ